MQIEQASLEDLDAICDLLQACKDLLVQQGNFQWDEQYPNHDDVSRDLARGSVMKMSDQEFLAGVVSFDNHQPPQYSDVPWNYDVPPVAVVHRLALHPQLQGRGLANQLMDAAEEAISQKGFRAIRLDTYTDNPGALAFYKKRGFQEAGTIHFPRRDLPFFCLEKEVIRDI